MNEEMQGQVMDPSQQDPSIVAQQGGIDPNMAQGGMIEAPGATAVPQKPAEYHTSDTNLIYKTVFLTSELKPVQDVLVGRTLIKAATLDPFEKDPIVIISEGMDILDGHHVWAGARLARIDKIPGLKITLDFDTARDALLKLSKKYERYPEIDTTKDIYISEFDDYNQLVTIMRKMDSELYDKVKNFVNRIGADELLDRLHEIKNLAPVVGYKKERMPTFCRRKGDYEKIIQDFRKIKIKDDGIADVDFKWNTGGGMI